MGSMSVRLCQGGSGWVEEVPVGSWRMQEAELWKVYCLEQGGTRPIFWDETETEK